MSAHRRNVLPSRLRAKPTTPQRFTRTHDAAIGAHTDDRGWTAAAAQAKRMLCSVPIRPARTERPRCRARCRRGPSLCRRRLSDQNVTRIPESGLPVLQIGSVQHPAFGRFFRDETDAREIDPGLLRGFAATRLDDEESFAVSSGTPTSLDSKLKPCGGVNFHRATARACEYRWRVCASCRRSGHRPDRLRRRRSRRARRNTCRAVRPAFHGTMTSRA